MSSFAARPQAMLTEIYISALLVDEGLADQVWNAWDQGRSAISGLLGCGLL